ncbi:MAG TPA: beta-ketoacyl synthase N-terminal-like domain-containing protein [Thermodesulfobacteriota bacterium]|nr:beta-ketoacyl synthase N-terminal-like domain-containing protein [Thermodesulfobacteriota bacterium]
MIDCFVGADNTITPLGFSTEELADQIKADRIAIRPYPGGALSPKRGAFSLIDFGGLWESLRDFSDFPLLEHRPENYTRLEMLHILSISKVLKQSAVNIRSPKTLIIMATTKGNIDLLEKGRYPHIGQERLYLWKLAETVQLFFGAPNKPLVVSNACISGLLAILIGSRLIKAGIYDHIIITGGDLVTEFVVSGFQSFKSLSPDPCKPFDAEREGLSLGEGCSTLVLSRDHSLVGIPEKIVIAGGASSNDANHLSGPSRTGEGLYLAIRKTLTEAGLGPDDLDYISAHGTATAYSDEMEAQALSRAGLEAVPVNSFKGYLGHTLGAAGGLESALLLYSLKNNFLFKSAGFNRPGTTQKINIIADHKVQDLKVCLKTASGFGGSNGALLFMKH